MQADPTSTKKTDSLTVFFALLGSGGVKNSSKMLVKLSPDHGNPQNIFSGIGKFFTYTRSKFVALNTEK